MEDKAQFGKILKISYVSIFTCFTALGVGSYAAFGDDLNTQVSLNIPASIPWAFNAILFSILLIPLTKFAVMLFPVSTALEELLPDCVPSDECSPNTANRVFSIGLRTALVAGCFAVASSLPFFALLASLTGTLCSVFIMLTCPALCHLCPAGHVSACP